MDSVPHRMVPAAVTRALAAVLLIAAATAAAIHLHDPPWVGDLTYGFRPPGVDSNGDRFRWTMGRGSFFVPSDATAMTLKLRSYKQLPPKPITVEVRVDDRPLAVITLPDARDPDPRRWVVTRVPLPRDRTSRRFRRIDVRVRHWLDSFYLGVHLGDITLERP